MTPAGRLTLSWVGKDRALLGTADGGYEWVERDDPRVTEVRLLHQLDVVGEVKPDSRAPSDNLLIVGDSYDALRSLSRAPEYAAEYRGKVKLVYIDPSVQHRSSVRTLRRRARALGVAHHDARPAAAHPRAARA